MFSVCGWCCNPEIQPQTRYPEQRKSNFERATKKLTNPHQQVINKNEQSISIYEQSSIDSREVFPMRDQQIQRLFNDGIQRDYFMKSQAWYENCAECNRYFSKLLPPNLLQCGHVCCEQCLEGNRSCVLCGKQKIAKIKNYKLLVDLESYKLKKQKRKQKQLYDFQVKISGSSQSQFIRNQKPDITIRSLLSRFDNFLQFEKKIVKIAFKNIIYLYSQVKDKPIQQYANFFLVNNKTNLCNSIMILNQQQQESKVNE